MYKVLLVFLSSLVLLSYSFAKEENYCISNKNFYEHLGRMELKFGEEDLVRDVSLVKLKKCLQSNQVCIVAKQENDIVVYMSKYVKLEPKFSAEFNAENSEVLYAAVQFLDGRNSVCVLANRSLVRALPWDVQAWVSHDKVKKSYDDLHFYGEFKMYMTPTSLVNTLVDAYNQKTSSR